MPSIPSEPYIIQLFQSRYGIIFSKIDEQGGKEGKTSDYEYCESKKRVFVCELKDFLNIKPSEEDGWEIQKHSDDFVSASRISNATNRVSKAISKAYKQLSKYDEPKMLIFLNYSPYLGVEDLEEVYRGYRTLGVEGNTKYLDLYAKRASEGKIKEIKDKIDLYIWIDTINTKELVMDSEGVQKEDKIWFRTVTEQGRKLAKKYFSNRIDIRKS